ncbi:MAG: hypothetical protein AABY15_00935 [Nanoarchaeota archaeon]
MPKTQIEVRIPEIIVPEPKVTVNVPETKVNIPPIKVPRPEVTVNVPKTVFPKMETPQVNVEFPKEMMTRLTGIHFGSPLPVILTNDKGKPYIAGSISTGGGRGSGVIIKDSDDKIVSIRDLLNANALNVSVVDASGDQITTFGGGTQYTEGDIDATITGNVTMFEDASDTIRPAGYPNPMPMRISTIADVRMSTASSGDIAHDSADSGNPVKIGGMARTTNPTAVANSDRVNAIFDDLGRQVMRPLQVRDLITTAYISITTGTETTLLAGVASTLHDLIYIMCTNESDAAVTIDFRSGTAGAIVCSVRAPANGTAGVALPVPIPQVEAAQAWTADLPDITGTTVDISALFSKEV